MITSVALNPAVDKFILLTTSNREECTGCGKW